MLPGHTKRLGPNGCCLPAGAPKVAALCTERPSSLFRAKLVTFRGVRSAFLTLLCQTVLAGASPFQTYFHSIITLLNFSTLKALHASQKW